MLLHRQMGGWATLPLAAFSLPRVYSIHHPLPLATPWAYPADKPIKGGAAGRRNSGGSEDDDYDPQLLPYLAGKAVKGEGPWLAAVWVLQKQPWLLWIGPAERALQGAWVWNFACLPYSRINHLL
jgi:hypothetical protein